MSHGRTTQPDLVSVTSSVVAYLRAFYVELVSFVEVAVGHLFDTIGANTAKVEPVPPGDL
jgi:hypothetical protein